MVNFANHLEPLNPGGRPCLQFRGLARHWKEGARRLLARHDLYGLRGIVSGLDKIVRFNALDAHVETPRDWAWQPQASLRVGCSVYQSASARIALIALRRVQDRKFA